MRELIVPLAERSYPIRIGALAQSLELEQSIFKNRRRLLFADRNVLRCHGAMAQLLAGGDENIIAFEPGESHKTPEQVIEFCREASRRRLSRRDLFIAFGGGVTGDMVGFAAAIYMRGCDFIQVPTTLLAMVDSSVGGKTGADLPEGKNLVGAFHQPLAVFADPAMLKTLPVREQAGALAEVVKYAMAFSEPFMCELESQGTQLLELGTALLEDIILTSCRIKAEVVAQDEREAGRRMLLNYGHTFGHAIEQLTDYQISHGEGVAIGMNTAAILAAQLGILPTSALERQKRLLQEFQLPVAIPKTLDPADIYHLMEGDKKTVGGVLQLVLPEACGHAAVHRNIPRQTVLQAIIEAQNNA